MNIVVLDGHTLNPGDLSWDGLRALGACDIHPRSSPDKVVERARSAQCVLTNKVVLHRPQIEALPQLRYIGVTATGFNVVDVVAARERGVVVTNVPSYGTRSVAQMTFALLLELTQHAGHHAQTVRDGRWSRSEDFCYWDYPLIELDGRTLGIVGLGRIGRAVAELGRVFGMNVLATVRSPLSEPVSGVSAVDLATLFRESDVISLHCPLTPDTQGLVNAARLRLMKPGGFLINTSRGALIDEAALAAALESGHLAGAALDVMATEPPPLTSPLLRARHCLITPHLAWATQAARRRLMDVAVANVRAFQEGRPQNVVS